MPIAIFALAGGLLGGAIASALGFSFAIGWAIGSLIGQLLAPSPTQNISGPRLENASPAVSNIIGSPIQIPFGKIRVPGAIIWSNKITEKAVVTTQKTKSGSGKTKTTRTTTYEYYLDFAVAISEGPILGITKIWANNKIIYDQDGTIIAEPWLKYTLYTGTETQNPDPLMQRILGVGNVPGYRGLAYIVFEQFKLEEFGNRAPYNIDFEVATDDGYQITKAIDIIHQGAGGLVLHNDQTRYFFPDNDTILTGLTGDANNWGMVISKSAPTAPTLLRIPDSIILALEIDSGYNITGLSKATFIGINSQGLYVAVFPFSFGGYNKAMIGFFTSGYKLISTYGPVPFFDNLTRIVFDKYFIPDNINSIVGLTPGLWFYYIDIFGGMVDAGGVDNTKSIRYRHSGSLESGYNTVGHIPDFDFSTNKALVAGSWQGLGPNVVSSYTARNIYATLVTTNDSLAATNSGHFDVLVYRYSEADMIGSWTGALSSFVIHPWIRLNNQNLSDISSMVSTGYGNFINNNSIISIYLIDNNIWVFGVIKLNGFSNGIICYKINSNSIPHADGYYEPNNIYVCPWQYNSSDLSSVASTNQNTNIQFNKGYVDFYAKKWSVISSRYITEFDFNTAEWKITGKESSFSTIRGAFEIPISGNNYLLHGVEAQPRAETQLIRDKISGTNTLSVKTVITKVCERAGLENGLDFTFEDCCVEYNPNPYF